MEEEKKIKKYGTREEVYNNGATMTKGKLTKDDIVFEDGKYKSKKQKQRGKELMSKMTKSE